MCNYTLVVSVDVKFVPGGCITSIVVYPSYCRIKICRSLHQSIQWVRVQRGIATLLSNYDMVNNMICTAVHQLWCYQFMLEQQVQLLPPVEMLPRPVDADHVQAQIRQWAGARIAGVGQQQQLPQRPGQPLRK